MTGRSFDRPVGIDVHEPEPFKILVVCTANVCRSPIAENMLRTEMVRRFGRVGLDAAVVRSAGTHALVGTPIHELARQVLDEHGIPVGKGVARQVTEPMVEQADLVLTASRNQRAWVVGLVPSVARRTFTLRQFGRLCAAGDRAWTGPPPGTGAELFDLAVFARSLVQPVPESEDTIVDPMGQGLEAFRECAATTAVSIDEVLSPLSAQF